MYLSGKQIGVLSGILITMGAWFLDHHERFGWVERIAAPRYAAAKACFRAMHHNGAVVRAGDEGFQEIVNVLAEDLTGLNGRRIEEIETLGWGSAKLRGPEGLRDENIIELRLEASDGQSVGGKFYGVGDKIEERYLDSPLFRWAGVLFWTGIAIAVVSVLFL